MPGGIKGKRGTVAGNCLARQAGCLLTRETTVEGTNCQSVFTVGLRHEGKGVYTGKRESHKTIFTFLAKK